MSTITLEDAQARLPLVIANLAFGEELVITVGPYPIARLVGARDPDHPPRIPGTCKGMLIIHAEDDEHLKDFEEYMP